MDGTRARALLGVSQHATQDDLRRAFRRRAFATHPDHGGDSNAFAATLSALTSLRNAMGATSDLAAPRERTDIANADNLHRVDMYDCVPTVRQHRRPTFQDVFESALRQRVAA